MTVEEQHDILACLQQECIIARQIKLHTLEQKELQVLEIIADMDRRLSNESYG